MVQSTRTRSQRRHPGRPRASVPEETLSRPSHRAADAVPEEEELSAEGIRLVEEGLKDLEQGRLVAFAKIKERLRL